MISGSFITESLQTAWRAKHAVYYPIVLRVTGAIFRLGVVLGLCFFVIASERAVHPLGTPGTLLFCLFMAIAMGAWWIFSASCRLMWWKTLELGGSQPAQSRRWALDLPAFLGIDLIFGLIRYTCFAAACLSILAVVLNHSATGVFFGAVSLFLSAFACFFKNVVCAARLCSGPGLLMSVQKAAGLVLKYPARGMVAAVVPEIVVLSIYGTALIMAVLGSFAFSGVLFCTGLAVSMIRPVFWTEFVHSDDWASEVNCGTISDDGAMNREHVA